MTNKTETLTSKYLGDLETWIASAEGQRYSCARQYPHPGYACDYHGATCVGCLIVAAARELRNKAPAPETPAQSSVCDGKQHVPVTSCGACGVLIRPAQETPASTKDDTGWPASNPNTELMHDVCIWLRSAIDCKEWVWGVQQWNAADDCERRARECLRATAETPGELEQLRRIDKAARVFVDAPPGLEDRARVALHEALFDGRPAQETSAPANHTGWPCVHPAKQIFFHGGVTGNLSHYRCNLCQTVFSLPMGASNGAVQETPVQLCKADTGHDRDADGKCMECGDQKPQTRAAILLI